MRIEKVAGTGEGPPLRQLGLTLKDKLVILVLVLIPALGATWVRLAGRKGGGRLPAREEAAVSVDINSADVRELTFLPGVGEKTARLIVDDREARGRFASIKDLERVRGIGPSTVQRIAPYAVCK